MANKVFLNKDDLIEQIYEGRQTFQTVIEAAASVMKLSDELRKRRKKVRILVDITKTTNLTADSLLAASDALNMRPKSKIALFGGIKLINKLANLVILATGRQKSVKIFITKAQAEKWLKSK